MCASGNFAGNVFLHVRCVRDHRLRCEVGEIVASFTCLFPKVVSPHYLIIANNPKNIYILMKSNYLRGTCDAKYNGKKAKI